MNLHNQPASAEASPAAAGADAPYPPAAQGWYCVIVLALAVMVNFLDRGILNLLVEPIKQDLKLSDIEMSLVMGFAFTFFYAVFGLPVARWIDRGTRKLIFSGGLFIFSIMTFACGLAHSFAQLFVARVGLGVGETTSGPSAYSMMSDYFPPHRLPRAISVMQVGFVLGNGLAFLGGAALIAWAMTLDGVSLPFTGPLRPWQIVLMTISIPGFIVALLMLTVKEPPRRGGIPERIPYSEVFKLARQHWPIYLPLFAGMGLRSAQMFGQQNWGAAFYSRTFGWGPSEVGVAIGFSILVSMPLGLILGNWLAERFQKQGLADANMRVVVISTLFSVPFGILFPLMPSPWLAVAFSLVAAMTSIMAAAPENAAIQSVTPNRLRGQMTFLFLFIMNVIGMGLGPIVVGALSQYVFGEANIRFALAAMGLLAGLPAIYIFWKGMAPYGRAYAAGGVDVGARA
ncbi:MFS transporter [Sphingomonas canadensis]|uniref:MFS transporter n=1 Tax=Sphingomonas canadensis TaxID=1219257 RepID=A0ABW3H8L8_9SPHN|nr:MFS transporter [Sphingomonas canadensis]MCW3837550.1 MFS transporter [Sphingomonas canadensis]